MKWFNRLCYLVATEICMVRREPAPELAWPDLAWPELAWPELAWPELAWPKLARPELAGA